MLGVWPRPEMGGKPSLHPSLVHCIQYREITQRKARSGHSVPRNIVKKSQIWAFSTKKCCKKSQIWAFSTMKYCKEKPDLGIQYQKITQRKARSGHSVPKNNAKKSQIWAFSTKKCCKKSLTLAFSTKKYCPEKPDLGILYQEIIQRKSRSGPKCTMYYVPYFYYNYYEEQRVPIPAFIF